IVPDGPYLPALETGWRYEHGKVRLAAGAGEGGGHIGLFTLWVLDPDDEHMLCHPALIARDIGSYAQGEAFLAQQGVASITGAVGPDLAGFGEVDDVLFAIAGPGHVTLGGRKRRSDRVHAGHHSLPVVNCFIHRHADAGHDPHIDYHVGRVS